jgi:hypothetical protein
MLESLSASCKMMAESRVLMNSKEELYAKWNNDRLKEG